MQVAFGIGKRDSRISAGGILPLSDGIAAAGQADYNSLSDSSRGFAHEKCWEGPV